LLGYRAEDLLRKTCQDLTHPEDRTPDLEYVQQRLAGKSRPYQLETRYVHKSGRSVWVLQYMSLVRDAQGHPLYFISQRQDITACKPANLEYRMAA